MVDYRKIFARNRQGINKSKKKFKMSEVQKVIFGYRKTNIIVRDLYGRIIGQK